MESVRRMICSVKEYLLLSQCNIGNALPWFSLCPALLVRDEGRHLGFILFFLFLFLNFLKLENLHSRRMSTSTPEAPKDSRQAPDRAAGTVICSLNSQCGISLVRFCWMLYRRNCNTLLSSSLQRCYINGVCFAFQLAALWKRRSVMCPWEHQLTSKCKKEKMEEEEEETQLGWRIWASRSDSTQHTSIYNLGQGVTGAHEREKWTTKSPQQTISSVCSVPVPRQTTELLVFPSWATEPISCRQSIKPNQSTAVSLTGQLVN